MTSKTLPFHADTVGSYLRSQPLKEARAKFAAGELSREQLTEVEDQEIAKSVQDKAMEAAKAVGEKSIEMLHLKELTPLTGYVRGGCTSIGMKKHFPTVIDASAQQFEKVYVSAGRIGAQLTLAPEDLRKAADATFADVIHA